MDKNLWELFILGIIFSFLHHLAAVVERNPYIGKSVFNIFIIMLLKSMLGGAIAVVVFYGLTDFYPEFSIELKVGLSATAAFMSEQMIIILFSATKKKMEGK